MRTDLCTLIDRMCAPEPHANSDTSDSWNAHREAEKLADVSLISEFRDFLNGGTTKKQRAAIYFIIGKIGKNAANSECAAVLIGYIRAERDKYALAALLSVLADIPKEKHVTSSQYMSYCKTSAGLFAIQLFEH